ncbi:MAG: hypothetical protein Q9202_000238 [Teloschistes flavicans]
MDHIRSGSIFLMEFAAELRDDAQTVLTRCIDICKDGYDSGYDMAGDIFRTVSNAPYDQYASTAITGSQTLWATILHLHRSLLVALAIVETFLHHTFVVDHYQIDLPAARDSDDRFHGFSYSSEPSPPQIKELHQLASELRGTREQLQDARRLYKSASTERSKCNSFLARFRRQLGVFRTNDQRRTAQYQDIAHRRTLARIRFRRAVSNYERANTALNEWQIREKEVHQDFNRAKETVRSELDPETLESSDIEAAEEFSKLEKTSKKLNTQTDESIQEARESMDKSDDEIRDEREEWYRDGPQSE